MTGIQKIFGRRPSSADFTLEIIATGFNAGTAAFKSLKVTDKVSKKAIYGGARSVVPIGWSKSKWEGSLEIVWWLDEFLDIQIGLEKAAKAIGGGIDDVEFDVFGHWTFPGDVRVRTIDAPRVSLVERTIEVDKTSEDANQVSVPLFMWKPPKLNGIAFSK